MASLARNGTDQAIKFGYNATTKPTIDFVPSTHKLLAAAPETSAASGETAPVYSTESVDFDQFNSYIKNGNKFIVDAAGKGDANNIAAVLVSVKLAGSASASQNYKYKIQVTLKEGQNKDHWCIAYKADTETALGGTHSIPDTGYTPITITQANQAVDVTTTAFAQPTEKDYYYDFLIWANGQNINADTNGNPGYSAIDSLFTVSLALQ